MKSPLREFVSATIGNLPGATLMIFAVTAVSLWVILGGDQFVDFINWAFSGK